MLETGSPTPSVLQGSDLEGGTAWCVVSTAGGHLSWSLLCISPERSLGNDVIVPTSSSNGIFPPRVLSICAGHCDRSMRVAHSAASEALSPDKSCCLLCAHTIAFYTQPLVLCQSRGSTSLLRKAAEVFGDLWRLSQSQNPYLLWLVVSATELMSCKYSPFKRKG